MGQLVTARDVQWSVPEDRYINQARPWSADPLPAEVCLERAAVAQHLCVEINGPQPNPVSIAFCYGATPASITCGFPGVTIPASTTAGTVICDDTNSVVLPTGYLYTFKGTPPGQDSGSLSVSMELAPPVTPVAEIAGCGFATPIAAPSTPTPTPTSTPTPTITAGGPTLTITPTGTRTPTLTATATRTATVATHTPGATATRTSTRLPTPPLCAGCGPAPDRPQCLGPQNCTMNGTTTDNLGLCRPGKHDDPWKPYLNHNWELIDGLWMSCPLLSEHGGLSRPLAPVEGDLLIGDGLGYTNAAVGSDVLTTMGWQPSASLCSSELICAVQTCRPGRMQIDTADLRLYVCLEGAGWQWVQLN